MTVLDGIILSIIQSATEFIPISSSGHLIIAGRFLKIGEVPILFDLVLHLGTLSATVLVYYRIIGAVFRDLALFIGGGPERRAAAVSRGNVRLFAYIVISTAVTGVVGLVFHDILASFFAERSNAVPLLIVCTGAILMGTWFVRPGGREIMELGIQFPVIIGLAQGVAMLPGVSRSGTTIAAALFMGTSRPFAGLYSFILSIPSVLAATAGQIALEGGRPHGAIEPALYLLAYCTTLAAGYGALKLLLGFLKRGKLYAFSFYCIAGGTVWYILMNGNVI